MIKKILALFLAIGFTSLPAQQSLKEQADKMFSKMAYATAIPMYKKSLERKFNSKSVQNIAECYRLINDYDNAAKWYAKVVELESKSPISVFYYAEALQQQGDYDEAKKWFLEYARLEPGDRRGKAFAIAMKNIPNLLENPNSYAIELCPFNSKKSDFGLFPYKNHLVFASSRQSKLFGKDFQWTDDNFLNLFYLPAEKEEWNTEEGLSLVAGDMNSKWHESNFTGATGTNRVFFNRNNFIEGKKGKSNEGVILLKIYQGEFDEFSITNIEEFQFNSDNYSVFHPALSPEGRYLYFVSDMPGGEGGTDIYVCKKQGQMWSKPKNLGPKINSEGDELFPFFHKDGNLYFASNGHPGLGHLDVFKVNIENDQLNPENLGAPINSAFDDFSFFISETGDEGFFSSNRPGGMGDDDIYFFEDGRPRLEILVRDKESMDPIKKAKITLANLDTEEEKEFVTDVDGMIMLNTDYDSYFETLVKTKEYDDVTSEVDTKYEDGRKLYSYVIELYNPPGFSVLVIDKATEEPVPYARIRLKEKKRDAQPEVFLADVNGRAFVEFPDIVKYKVEVDEPDYLHYEGVVGRGKNGYYGDTIIPIEKIEMDKAIVLKNIRYDFDQWFIRDDAKPDLVYLTTLMRDNPSIRVQLSSHTDSRGSDVYNKKLSQRRADAAVKFIVGLGIERSRIEAVGFGETKLLNECSNGIACSEDKHFMNRRTEFKIIGTVEGVNMGDSILDTEGNPKSGVKYVPEGASESRP